MKHTLDKYEILAAIGFWRQGATYEEIGLILDCAWFTAQFAIDKYEVKLLPEQRHIKGS